MLQAGDKIGPYVLVRKLGQGSFGVVWLAERHGMVKTQFALKMPLDNEIDLESFRAEAAIWAKATGHINVLPIIEADVYDGQIVIVSEYLMDGSLSDWLKANFGKAPSTEIAVEMTSGILAGLQHIHSQNIIHRDLKPANIMLQGITPRLTDFGVARIQSSSIHSQVAAGSPAYMAPEAFDAVRSLQTDIWSAGVIGYQLLTGRLPFPQTDSMALLNAILRQPPAPFSVVAPAALQTIIGKALEKDPARRYQSAAEMRHALITATRATRAETPLNAPAEQEAGRRMVINLAPTPQPDLRQTQPMEPVPKSGKNLLAVGLAAMAVFLALVAVVIASLKGSAFLKSEASPTPTTVVHIPTPSVKRSELPSPKATLTASATILPKLSPSIVHSPPQPDLLPATFTQTFTGTINNKINVEMRIVRNGAKLTGTYFYRVIGTSIALEGTIDEQNRVVLYGYDKGKLIDIFRGRLIANRQFLGIWSNATGERSLPFALHASN